MLGAGFWGAVEGVESEFVVWVVGEANHGWGVLERSEWGLNSFAEFLAWLFVELGCWLFWDHWSYLGLLNYQSRIFHFLSLQLWYSFGILDYDVFKFLLLNLIFLTFYLIKYFFIRLFVKFFTNSSTLQILIFCIKTFILFYKIDLPDSRFSIRCL